MIQKLQKKLINWLLSKSVETHHLGSYMLRYWLWRPRDKTKPQIRLHNILRSDRGRDLHNHPWWYLTIILSGGYWEVTECSMERYIKERDVFMLNNKYVCLKWYGAGSILFRTRNHWHQLVIMDDLKEKGIQTWTLFITGPVKQKWGFNTKEGFVPHEKYLGDYNGYNG